MFWTDAVQANERLHGTVVNYDSVPTYISEVRGNGQALCNPLDKPGGGATKLVPLEDDKWKNFRDLPKLGWFNYLGNGKILPLFLERRAYNSRSHGLTPSNTYCHIIGRNGAERSKGWSLIDTFSNPGYHETKDTDEAYPKASEILMALDGSGNGVAFSPKFCIATTEEGMKWLYRKTKRIGFFTGTDSLNLFPGMGYYQEELTKCPSFDLTNIKEF